VANGSLTERNASVVRRNMVMEERFETLSPELCKRHPEQQSILKTPA
jgi:hypothetical protein